MFIHYSLWFKWIIHLKETYAHGSRWARKEETPLSKNPIQEPNYFSLLSLSVFYIERNGGRSFSMVKPNSIWEKIKAQIQLFYSYRLGSESQTQPSQWTHSVDQHNSSFCVLSSLWPTSSPKVPCRSLLSLANPISSKNTHRALQRGLDVVDSICLFLWQIIWAGYAIQASMWIFKYLLLMEKIT